MRVNQVKPDVNVRALDDAELILIHGELHSNWKEFDENNRPVADWDEQSLVDVHERVVTELEGRNLPHQDLPGLDGVAMKQVEIEVLADSIVEDQ